MTEHKRRDYPWRKGQRRIFAAAAVFCAGLALMAGAVYWRGVSPLHRQLEAIHAKGEPATPGEYRQQHPDPPAEENGDTLYLKSFAAAKGSNDSDEFRKHAGRICDAKTGELTTDEFRRWMEDQVAANAEALRLLHEAADKPRTRFAVDMDKGSLAETPNLLKVRNSATLLQLEALLAAGKGDTAGAVEAFRAGLALSNALREGPSLILQMVRVACYGITLDGLRPSLELVRFSDEELARLQGMLAAADDPEALSRGLIGERVMMLVAFDHPDQMVSGLNTADEWLPGGKSVAAGLLRMASTAGGMREKYLAVVGGAIDACRKAPQEALPLLQQTAAVIEQDKSLITPLSLGRTAPNFYRAEVQCARSLAMVRSAVTALAVERWRLANAGLPENIEGLIPACLFAVQADPFDGKALRYRKEEGGYAVYSVGENRVDDEGREGKRKNMDVVFRVVCAAAGAGGSTLPEPCPDK